MRATVLVPSAADLAEVTVECDQGPPQWSLGSPERRDRIRAAITNSGYSLPSGRLSSATCDDRATLDLPLALCALLSDPSHRFFRRAHWIAWGGLELDGSTVPIEEQLVNDLTIHPCVGRIWRPTDHIPTPDEDAVITVIDVADLAQAWDVVTSLVEMERVIFDAEGADAMRDP